MRRLSPSPSRYQFKDNQKRLIDTFTVILNHKRKKLVDELKSSRTLAFVVLKGDSIVIEKYFGKQRPSDLVQAFSMTKSFTSLLLGCAVDDGFIESVDQPVTDFVPELKPFGFEKILINDLLNMMSNIDYKENGNPLGAHNKFYYTSELERAILQLRLNNTSNKNFVYRSGDIALLGLILKRALSPQNITEYMQEKIWTPLGMENAGVWTVDHEDGGLEKTWCCLAASARDYLKIGRLYLSNGKWGGHRLVSENWIEKSTAPLSNPTLQPDTTKDYVYHYNWWAYPKRKVFVAVGKGGQYMYIKPEEQIIVLRLGKSEGMNIRTWFSIFEQTINYCNH